MSNQAMTYESLKEVIRQEFEDILEPEQAFLLQKRSDLKEMGVFIDICPGAILRLSITCPNSPSWGYEGHSGGFDNIFNQHPYPRGKLILSNALLTPTL